MFFLGHHVLIICTWWLYLLGRKKDKMMGKTSTAWTQATTDPNKALIGLVSCIQNNKNAWIEIRKNGDQDYAIMKKNPLLNDPFNWTAYCCKSRNEKDMADKEYFNDTEKDLAYNWTWGYGNKEAVQAYEKDGTIKEGLLLYQSFDNIGHPVKIEDANAYRRDITGDNYEYGCFVHDWEPKKGIKRYIVDDSIDEVFVICFDDGPVDVKKAFLRAARFLAKYADKYSENPSVKEETDIWKVGVAYENYGYIKVTKDEAATEQEAIEVARKKLKTMTIYELDEITEPLEETKEIDIEGVLKV